MVCILYRKSGQQEWTATAGDNQIAVVKRTAEGIKIDISPQCDEEHRAAIEGAADTL